MKQTLEEQLRTLFGNRLREAQEHERRTKDNTSKDGHQPRRVYRQPQVEAPSRK